LNLIKLESLNEGIKLTLNKPEVLLFGPPACSLADQVSLSDLLVSSAALSGRFFIIGSQSCPPHLIPASSIPLLDLPRVRIGIVQNLLVQKILARL
jgi:hypothetical protein